MFARKRLAVCLLGLTVTSGAGAQDDAERLDILTVTGTREAESLLQTPASVGIVQEDAIHFAAPSHPQQIMSQIPGVAVAVTNGEGHTTAIRQPFTTSPLYLFLEDGVPTRATGFFNHNALYELNVPAASGIEVVRGPGTALYGSDAIGGIVNILTRAPAAEAGGAASLEGGSYGWYRLLASADSGIGRLGGVRADLNISHTDGWRKATDYDRISAGLRWDYAVGERTTMRTSLNVTRIDQQTGANSPLIREDYLNNPKKNNFSIAFREVEAMRLSSTIDHELGDYTMVSVTPYVRRNVMDLNASFRLSFDPTIARSEVWSYGVLAKWRRDFPELMQARLIAGIDVDYSPGSREEDNLLVTRTGAGADRNYESYTIGARIYDYDVDYRSASPYLHTEFSPTTRLRVMAGLRYDDIRYDMSNRLSGQVNATTPVGPRVFHQLPDAEADFSHWSPKFGLTYALHPSAHLYASHNHGFRVPSESQLFRAGSDRTADSALVRAQNAVSLKPIKADQTEVGLRGEAAGWRYDVVAYLLRKRDDLVNQTDPLTDVSITVNAGETEHKGIELGLGREFGRQWRFDAAVSHARHRYVDWVSDGVDYSGTEMESAPRWMSNTRLTWLATRATRAQLEWVHIGSYWLEAQDQDLYGKYEGHDLLNLRLTHRLNESIEVFGRVMNLTDERYADSASVSSQTPVYSPGLPRTWYAGVEIGW
ncbi:MAG: TonB-dependent receptor [Gammaproteobacteria bacterium]|jgi:outer membrane receptor protein involved in Fe transport|nr:TonB-dependent receptor [Gammaproteobacteria bacterium]